MRHTLLGLLLALGLLCITPTSTAIQREFDKHTGSDTSRFEAIERSLKDEETRRRDDDWKSQQVQFKHESDIAKLMIRMDLVETWQREASAKMWQILMIVLTAAVGVAFTAYRSHQSYKMLREREKQGRS